jgi:tRNA(Ile)-lysidine synthase
MGPAIIDFQDALFQGLRPFVHEDAPLLAAVSGGPDSTALGHALAALARSGRRSGKVVMAHLNHRARGADSDADEEFVRGLSRDLGCACIAESVDVPALARARKRSFEDAARVARYDFLARAARQSGAAAVVTAHTRDDQVETVLLNLMRGSGPRGLAAMRASRPILRGQADIPLLRPLLGVSREAIRAYCAAAGLSPREDATNRDTRYLRNWVRLELLPLLERESPDIRSSLLALSEAAASAEDLASSAAAGEPVRFDNGGKSASFDARSFSALHPAVAFAVLSNALERLTSGLSAAAFARIDRLARQNAGRSVPIGSGWRARREKDSIVLENSDAPRPSPPAAYECPLVFPGLTRLPGGAVIETAALVPLQDCSGPLLRDKPREVEHADADALASAHCVVRTRRPGDRFHPLGAAGSCSLKKFLIESGVPAAARADLPLVARDRRVLWVCGVRLSDDLKVSPSTRRVARMVFTAAERRSADR